MFNRTPGGLGNMNMKTKFKWKHDGTITRSRKKTIKD